MARVACRIIKRYGDVAQLGEQLPCTHQAAGSTPVISTILGRLAQLGEHLVYTERVGGSSPSPPTMIGVWRSLASALALGARGRRFESYYPDHLHILSTIYPISGNSSVVEHRLAKARVVSSNLITRSISLTGAYIQYGR